MNTSRTPLPRLELGGFTLLLGLVLVLMIGGLFATDRLIRVLANARRHDDAVSVALQLERVVASRARALTVFEELGSSGRGRATDEDEFHALVEGYAIVRPGTRLVELFDSLDTPVYKDFLGDTPADSLLLARTAAGLGPVGEPPRATVLRRSRGFPLLTVGQRLAGPTRGWALAVFDFNQITQTLSSSALDTGQPLALVIGPDTIVLREGDRSSGGGVRTTPALVHLQDSATWTLNVGQYDEVYRFRAALWLFGGFTVLLLGFGVLREGRQAERIRERSTELERLSSELLRANRMKSEFLASVSHELRTPLNAIVGFVELLKDGVYGDLSARQVAPVDRIAVSAMHLRHLVDQVLDIAKIAAGRLEISKESVSLRTYVLNIASELESLFSERGLSLSISIPASLPRIRTDPTHLRQILVNLIGNAVKYTPSGGVAIRARLVTPTGSGSAAEHRLTPQDPALSARAPDPNQSWIALHIVDTGVGIPPADHERVFDEFEQVNTGVRGASAERGTGLGLAISRRLARLLGGDITLDSQIGKGSTFTLWIAAQPGDVASRRSGPEPSSV